MASNPQDKQPDDLTRREFLGGSLRGAGLLALGALGGSAIARTLAGGLGRGKAAGTLWQIDPDKCTQCGKCACFAKSLTREAVQAARLESDMSLAYAV